MRYVPETHRGGWWAMRDIARRLARLKETAGELKPACTLIALCDQRAMAKGRRMRGRYTLTEARG